MKRENSEENVSKRRKRQHKETTVCIKVELSDSWSTVIASGGGKRFYYNANTDKSYWQIPEDDKEYSTAETRLAELRKWILVLVAVTRGWDYKRYLVQVEGGDEMIEKIDAMIEQEAEEVVEQKEGTTENDKVEGTHGIALAYGSDESSDEESNKEDKTESEESENEFALNLSDLDDLEEGEGEERAEEEEKPEEVTGDRYTKYSDNRPAIEFLDMLTTNEVDPFSSYELEVDRIYNEPEFVGVDERLREVLFDYWCSLNRSESIQKEESKNNVDLFVQWLDSIEKAPKFFFELKRKYRKDETFRNLQLDQKQMSKVFKAYMEYKKSGDKQKWSLFLSKIPK